MSKTKTLFTVALLVLLGSMGAAQAQLARYEVVTVPVAEVREGGLAEEAGPVYIIADNTGDTTGDLFEGATITLNYSAPISGSITTAGLTAAATAVVTGAAPEAVKVDHKHNLNSQNGRITLAGTTATTVSIVGLLFDVSDTTGPVTVRVSVTRSTGVTTGSLVASTATSGNVINAVGPGVEITTVRSQTVRTRGTGSSGSDAATFLFKEGFRGAFDQGDTFELEVEGLPDGVVMEIASQNTSRGNAVIVAAGDVNKFADLSTSSLRGDEGEDMTATITLANATIAEDGMRTDSPGAPGAEFMLTFTLMANPNATPVRGLAFPTFPLDRGDINARLTFSGNNFDDAFTPSVVVFRIRPAQCTLLFPVVSALPSVGYDTALSITNPGYLREPASGGLSFTFYGMDNPAVVYDTTLIPNPPGMGLEADGTLAPGGTYQVLASQILAATDWGATFRGHVHLTADYVDCAGVGWVTDFMGVNQAYTATVIDNDTGSTP